MKKWLNTTDQTMGNWVSKEERIQDLEALGIEEIPVFEEIPFEIINKKLEADGKLVLIGFDILQIPKYTINHSCPK